MARLPASPTVLPEALKALLSRLAEAWASSNIRPRVPADVSAHWDSLIEEWPGALTAIFNPLTDGLFRRMAEPD